jgi:hypothetical protein
MRKVRSVFALAALAAAFGLLAAVPAGRVRAEEKDKEHDAKEIAATNKAADKVNDIGTANALIEYATREGKENPVALLTAVEMLAAAGEGIQVKPGDEDAKTVEGAKAVKDPENYYVYLRGLVKKAEEMEGGKSDAVMALAKEATEKIDGSEKAAKAVGKPPRGTAGGFTSTTVIVEAGKTVSINRKMMSNTACTTTATKVVNKGVPLGFKVIGPDKAVYSSGNMTINWRAPKGPVDPVYTIQVTNHHSADVAVKVTTN